MRLLASVFISATLAMPASAAVPGLFRAYLSVTGNDANPCTLALPCRLLPAALNAVADGGEVWMLDSANYNSGLVTIAKSVTVLAVPGAIGSVVSTGAGNPAIRVPTGGFNVTLRNLVVTGLIGSTGATSGVEVNSGSHVILVDCDLSNMTDGVNATPAGRATLLRGMVRGMSGNGAFADTNAELVIDGTKLVANAVGVSVLSQALNASNGTLVKDATLSGNSIGIQAAASGQGGALVRLHQSVIASSSTRGLNLITVGGTCTSLVILSGSRLANAVNATTAGTGNQISTYGNNTIDGGQILGMASFALQ